MKQLKFGLVLLISILLFQDSFAQENSLKLTDIQLNNLADFNNPASNWSLAATVSGSPTDTKLKTTLGKGILINNIENLTKGRYSNSLVSNLQHGDIQLELDFMMPKGSNSGIYLQGRYELQLLDSWGVKKPTSSDCGGIYQRWNEANQKGYEGHAPRVNAVLAPGLWQHLSITFQAPKFLGNKKISDASFIKVVLNGMTIHENVRLSGPTRGANQAEVAAGPIIIQGDHGGVAFKNIQYALLNDFEFKFKSLTYDYYDASQGVEKIAKTPTRSGSAEKIDYRLADNADKFKLVFKGKFDIENTDDYTFTFLRNGIGSLKIDGQEVINSKWLILPEITSTKVNLTAGEHTLELTNIKDFTWRPSALALMLQKPNCRPVALHEGASLPDTPADPLMSLEATTETIMQRSYWTLNESKKYTHAVSVGSPAGIHFVYNLNQGGIFAIWKGNFLRTTDMWFERGEPQVAQALGSSVAFSGKFPVAPAGVLPDTLDDRKTLVYKGYSLDNEQTPSFQYELNGIKIEDKIMPNTNQNGLIRTININNASSNLQYRLADGQIEEIAKGLYVVDKKYYISVSKELKPSIVKTSNSQALVVLNDAKKPFTSISYEILW